MIRIKLAPQATGRLLFMCARLAGVSQRDLLRALLLPALDRLYNRFRTASGGDLPALDTIKLMDDEAFQRLASEPVRRHYLFKQNGTLYVKTGKRLPRRVHDVPQPLRARLIAWKGSSRWTTRPAAKEP